MKEVVFLGNSLNALRDFPDAARRECGRQLSRVQDGLMPDDWKPLITVGKGVYEIRVQLLGQWRVVYVAKFSSAIYVLHAFAKKTQQTAKADIDIATTHYRSIEE
jgi:phage-related protein